MIEWYLVLYLLIAEKEIHEVPIGPYTLEQCRTLRDRMRAEPEPLRWSIHTLHVTCDQKRLIDFRDELRDAERRQRRAE